MTFDESGGLWFSLDRINSSMRAKLIAAGASAAIVALSIVAIVAFSMTKDAISDTGVHGLNAVATNQYQQIVTLFESYQGDLDSVSGDTQLRRSLLKFLSNGDQVEHFRITQVLTDRVSAGTVGHSFDLHNLYGQIIASSDPGHIGPSNYDATETGIVIDADPTITNVDISEIRLSAPIMLNGSAIGYATLHRQIDELNDIVTHNVGRGETGESLLLSRNSIGEIRFITELRFNENGDYHRPISEADDTRIETLSVSGRSGMGTGFTDYRGKNTFGSYRYIKSADLGLVVKMDQDEVLTRLNSFGFTLFLVILCVSIAVVGAAFFIAGRLVRPIDHLIRSAELFSRGQFDSRVAIESPDEIGVLGETFNVMASSLQVANDELESRVESRTADLKRSNQDLEQFAYVASHDLQEPLRMVSSYTQLLSRRYVGKLDSDADEFIGYAVDGAKRMQSLINDLLTYSRAGRQDGTYESVEAKDIVEEAVQNLDSRIQAAGAEVTFGDLPTLVADRPQLVSVFQNLISNSIKYRSASRDSRITIDAERQAQAWSFSVQDNGIGIDAAFTDRIFTIFQRLHGREEYQGTGIGLAVVKKIVERAGGKIGVESVEGEGSTFTFTVRDREAAVDSNQDEEGSTLRAAS